MSDRKTRYARMVYIVSNDQVTLAEAIVHIYNWTRFEIAVARRDRAATQALKYGKKMHDELEIIGFRIEMSE